MLQAQDVMLKVAALCNDQGLANGGVPTLFTFSVQLPYLNMALAELRETLEQFTIQKANKTTTNLVVIAGITSLPQYDPLNPPPNSLPKDLIAPQRLWERTNELTAEDYIDMQQVEFLPPYNTKTTDLVYWTYQDEGLFFIGATSDRQLRLDYIADTLPPIIDPTDSINVINAQSFLNYRTGALCAEFIGENPTRAQSLNGDAQLAMDRFLQIDVKDKQGMPTRRRPFQAGFRGRGYM